MSKKSDSRRALLVSATEASRSFSRLLDQVASGHRFTLHRHGSDVAVLGPPQGIGRRASECRALLAHLESELLDDAFGQDLRVIVEGELSEQPARDF